MTPNNNSPNADATNAADDYATYPYYFYNRKNKKNNMTPNTDTPNYYASDAADDAVLLS